MEDRPDPDAPDTGAIDALLRRTGLRVTRQRQAILRVLLESRDHPDAEQVLAQARRLDPTVSQATAYRTLSALAEKGVLRAHQFDGLSSRYEVLNRPHHDHMIDLETGEIIEFQSAEIEWMKRRIAAEYGLEIVDHRLELYCRKRR